VSIMPQQWPMGRSFSLQRTILFWVMMIALAAVLWQMANNGTSPKSAQSISYSDFLNYVDQNNIATANLYLSQNTAEMKGLLRNPPRNYKVTIPKEVIPDLTERLRKQGTAMEVQEVKSATGLSIAVTLVPLIAILCIWYAVLRRRKSASLPSPTSGPLGD
jgi:cell division protease FtsH